MAFVEYLRHNLTPGKGPVMFTFALITPAGVTWLTVTVRAASITAAARTIPASAGLAIVLI